MEFDLRILFYTAPTAIFVAFVIKLLIANHNDNSKRKQFNLPPSPPSSLPIIGHLHLLKDPIHRTLRSLSDSYGKVLRLRLGSRDVLLISSASAAEECFTKNDIVFANRPKSLAGFHFHYDSSTVVAANYGDHWRNLRRVMTLELFSSSRLASLSHLREHEVRLLVEEIGGACGSGSAKIDLKTKFTDISFNVMTMVLFGKRFYGEFVEDAEEAKWIREVIREGVELGGASNAGDLLPFLQRWDVFGTEKKMVRVMKDLDKFLQDLVNERRGVSSENRNKYVVDNLLALQQTDPLAFTDDIIKGIVLILLVAGTDTTSSTMEWTMSLMLNQPHVMKRVKAEIDIVKDQDHPLMEQDLPELKYLHCVVNESHRLFPPAPLLVPHESSDHCVVVGYDIPPQAMLMVNAWAIHRDPEVWDDPTSFSPERFERLNEDSSVRFMPFGLGRRGCPGAGLGNRVVWLTLGSLIQSFDWERIGDKEVDLTELVEGLSMLKANPLEATCTPRQYSPPKQL